MSIPRRLARRHRAPHALSEGPRHGHGAHEQVEARERDARRHSREAFLRQHDVGADTVLRHHIRKPALVGIEAIAGAVALEPHPAAEHKTRQFVAGGVRERRGRVEAPANLGRVDSEQTDTPDRRDVDGVAVDDGAYEQRVRSIKWTNRRRGSYCCGRTNHGEQKLHRGLLCHALTGEATRSCKRSASCGRHEPMEGDARGDRQVE